MILFSDNGTKVAETLTSKVGWHAVEFFAGPYAGKIFPIGKDDEAAHAANRWAMSERRAVSAEEKLAALK